eukprot:6794897-Prymnesium_polylepis.1
MRCRAPANPARWGQVVRQVPRSLQTARSSQAESFDLLAVLSSRPRPDMMPPGRGACKVPARNASPAEISGGEQAHMQAQYRPSWRRTEVALRDLVIGRRVALHSLKELPPPALPVVGADGRLDHGLGLRRGGHG